MELGRVAGMGEPLATMARCNAKARAASDAAKSDRISRSVPADLLLLQAPARLDRIEVMRVRREVDDADAAGRAESDDALVVMRGEIVEQQDVAPLELWEQLLGEPLCRLYSAVISPAFPSGRRARIASNSSRETLEGVPPPFLRGLTWPSRRNCHTQRFAVASPIQKRRASRMYPPSPRSCASTSLCLNSIGWASAMPRLDQTRIRDATMISSAEQWG